jgi:hypothetical protein
MSFECYLSSINNKIKHGLINNDRINKYHKINTLLIKLLNNNKHNNKVLRQIFTNNQNGGLSDNDVEHSNYILDRLDNNMDYIVQLHKQAIELETTLRQLRTTGEYDQLTNDVDKILLALKKINGI